MKVKSLSHFRLLATPWTTAHQAPLSMGFSRQEYWSGGAMAFSDFTLTAHLNLERAKLSWKYSIFILKS